MVDNTRVDTDPVLNRTDVDLDDDDTVLENRQDNMEPATAHDVGEGAGLGVVGGAVVGGLAGGPLAWPIGAVIGAVVGGIASAAGVAAVDKHDHDYTRTETGTDVDDPQTDYRGHYQTVYGTSGTDYDQYHGAYVYGNDLANDPRYADTEDWDTVQTGAQTDWNTRNEGSWDRVRDAARYSWQRARGRRAIGAGQTVDTTVETNNGPRSVV